MATKFKTQKNLKSQRSEYNTYYGDFRGVDFSSDHSLVSPNRFAYLVNMYKDYKSKTGTAIETIPGYRKVFAPTFAEDYTASKEIYGVHRCGDRVLVHCGSRLIEWGNFPSAIGVEHLLYVGREGLYNFERHTDGGIYTPSFWYYDIGVKEILDDRGTPINSIKKVSAWVVSWGDDGEEEEREITRVDFEYDVGSPFWNNFMPNGNGVPMCDITWGGSVLSVFLKERLGENERIKILCKEDDCVISSDPNIDCSVYSGLNEAKSISVSYGDKTLIFDGKDAYAVDPKNEDGTPIKPLSTNSDIAYIPTTYKGIVPDGANANGGYEYEQRNVLSPYFKNEFEKAVYKGTDGYIRVYPLALKAPASAIKNIKIRRANGTEYDVENYYSLGEDNTVNIIGNFNEGEITENDTIIVTATYKDFGTEDAISKCTVACAFDNRVFVAGNPDYPNTVWFSRPITKDKFLYFGADDWFNDGIGTVPVTGLIPVGDKLLVLKADDVDGTSSVYLHSKYTTGDDIVTKAYPAAQGINGVGCFGACTNFFDDPVFVSRRGLDAIGIQTVSTERALEHRSTLVDAKLTNLDLSKSIIEEWGGYLWLFVGDKVFLADSRQRYTDALGVVQYEWYYLELGENSATCVKNINDILLFGTKDGVIYRFNFDQRNQYGEFVPACYTFDGKAYTSGCATKMDNCGIPHLTKSTVKKSMVAKVKALPASTIKVNVRTNKIPYHEIEDRNSAIFSFEDMDFDNFSFLLEDSGIFTIREKEKKWVEKQIYMYSDEPMRPFALYYLAYRYTVAGRYKE